MRYIPTVAYEAMLLFPQSANVDLKGTVEFIKETLTKNGAEIVSLKKWGDRQLAYPINKQKRGVYILTYFNAPTDKLAAIDRAFNLSETVMRHLITRADHLNVEEMKSTDGQIDLTIEANLRAAATMPVEPAAVPAAAPAGDE
jgi:small subunit ribosomal protein S6